MATAQEHPGVTKYQFQIDDEKWRAWKETVPRTKSLEERIIELIEADTEGRVQPPDPAPVGDENGPDEGVSELGSGVVSDAEPADESRQPTTEPVTAEPNARPAVEDVVDEVATGWEDTDERLAARRAAACAVLEHAVATGNAVGKSEAIDQFYDDYPVEGQNDETWWRKNVRPVLKAVGEYSQGQRGYVVDLKDA